MANKQPRPKSPYPMPPVVNDPERQSIILSRVIKRQNESRIRQHYAETAGRITEEWKPSQADCDCDYQEDGAHKRISCKVRSTKRDESGNPIVQWASICPIRYYILLAWRAITEKRVVPSEELYWALLNKPEPQTGIAEALPSVSDYWKIVSDRPMPPEWNPPSGK